MTDLSPISAFGTPTPRAATYGGLCLRENTDVGLASLALRKGQVPPRPFGLILPGPGGWAQGEGVSAFWSGPGQWMIEGTGRGNADFASEVSAATTGVTTGACVTEQTDGWVRFDLTTGDARQIRALLERLVNLPPAATAPGCATRTGLHHMSVFVIRRAPGHLAILAMRSAAGSLWHVLSASAQRL